MQTPLLTLKVCEQLHSALQKGEAAVECSLDLERSRTTVELSAHHWIWQATHFPYLDKCKERTIYHWNGGSFEPIARFTSSLIKLVPTEWGPPTFEIDGIKMLPTAHVSPYADAEHKVSLIEPRGKVILDTCGGLGYFAACCLEKQATRVLSYEKSSDVLWLRSLNPWSPTERAGLSATHGDILEHITELPDASVDAVLHDPPRFAIAGELYSRGFYAHLARVLKHRGKLFHYTGSPNKLTTRREVPHEVANRLREVGFVAEVSGDGVLATKKGISWS